MRDYSNINHTGCLLLCTEIQVQSSSWECLLFLRHAKQRRKSTHNANSSDGWLLSQRNLHRFARTWMLQHFQTTWQQNLATANNSIWSALCKSVIWGRKRGAGEKINCKCLQWNLDCVFNMLIQPGSKHNRNNKLITIEAFPYHRQLSVYCVKNPDVCQSWTLVRTV